MIAQEISGSLPDVRVGVFGFEPALQRPLEILLAAEPGLSVLPHTSHKSPDVLIIAPPSPDWLDRLQAQFPGASLLAMVDWYHRDRFVGFPIRGYVDPCLGYAGLLDLVRQHIAA